MDFLKKAFADKLTKAIEMAGMSQKDFAEKIRVEPPTVSRWCKGKNRPDPDRMTEIMEILGVNEEYFLNTSQIELAKSSEEITKEYIMQVAEQAAEKVLEKQAKAPTVPEIKDKRQKLIDDIISLLPSLNTDHLRQIQGRIVRANTSNTVKKPKNS